MAYKATNVRASSTQILRGQLDDFFQLLSAASTGTKQAAGIGSTSTADILGSNATLTGAAAAAGDVSLASLSMSVMPRVAPAAAGGSAASKASSEARLDADSAARRHLEQLLLRLDFSGWYSSRELQRREREARERRMNEE